MKQPKFVRSLSNVQLILDGVKTLHERGAAEAGVLVVHSNVGYGKTDTCEWYATQNPSAFLRAKEEWKPNWMLRELATVLGLKPEPHLRYWKLFDLVCEEIQKQLESHPDFVVIIDEADHVVRHLPLIESLRDIGDTTKVGQIYIGMRHIVGNIKARYPMVHSRICKVVEVGPATAKDVRAMCAAFTDAKIADDMVKLIHQRTGGRLRSIKNAIAFVDAHAKRTRGEITAESWGSRPLLNDDRDQPEPDNE